MYLVGILLSPNSYNQSFRVRVEMYGTPTCENLVSRGSSVEVTMLESDPTLQLFVFTAPVGRLHSRLFGHLQQSFPFYPRVGASMTELPDGRIVIIGGARLKTDVTDVRADNPNRAWLNKDSYAEILDTVEIFDPATGVFELVTLPSKVVADEVDPINFVLPACIPRGGLSGVQNQIAVIGGLTQTTVDSPFKPALPLNCSCGQSAVLDRRCGGCTGLSSGDASGQRSARDVELILVTGGTNDTADAQSAQSTFEVIEPIPQNHIKELGFMIGPRFGPRRLR